MSVLIVTGTGTGVGKTVVTAAVAALAHARQQRCVVVKPGQTGVSDSEPGDLDEIARLAGDLDHSDLVELVRYPDPLSPAAAARRSGRTPLDPAHCVRAVLDADARADLVLVEGAGGLLVRYDEDGFTLAELARILRAPVLVVTGAGLGTLNSTALTLEAMAHRGLELSGLVIGSWPADPGIAERSNVADLEMLCARPLAGALEADLAAGDRQQFAAAARRGLGPALGGSFDASRFRRAVA